MSKSTKSLIAVTLAAVLAASSALYAHDAGSPGARNATTNEGMMERRDMPNMTNMMEQMRRMMENCNSMMEAMTKDAAKGTRGKQPEQTRKRTRESNE